MVTRTQSECWLKTCSSSNCFHGWTSSPCKLAFAHFFPEICVYLTSCSDCRSTASLFSVSKYHLSPSEACTPARVLGLSASTQGNLLGKHRCFVFKFLNGITYLISKLSLYPCLRTLTCYTIFFPHKLHSISKSICFILDRHGFNSRMAMYWILTQMHGLGQFHWWLWAGFCTNELKKTNIPPRVLMELTWGCV